jgi:hypothetical protein
LRYIMACRSLGPVSDLRHLKERVDTLFPDVLGRAGSAAAPDAQGAWRPAGRRLGGRRRLPARVDLPGVAAGDVSRRDRRGRALHSRRAASGGIGPASGVSCAPSVLAAASRFRWLCRPPSIRGRSKRASETACSRSPSGPSAEIAPVACGRVEIGLRAADGANC